MQSGDGKPERAIAGALKPPDRAESDRRLREHVRSILDRPGDACREIRVDTSGAPSPSIR
ncbi:MAG: hypothetical protein CL931_11475 [Deltaproteobacteria bacterium]|nr:hypothetical protein [Deltaproteobacteria bacterium]